MNFKRIVFTLAFCFPIFLFAQESNAPQPKKISKAEKERIKKEEKELKEAHKAEERAKKHYQEIQTKEVRKRMKQSRRKARKNNEQLVIHCRTIFNRHLFILSLVFR